jgi:hypothetical protein
LIQENPDYQEALKLASEKKFPESLKKLVETLENLEK